MRRNVFLFFVIVLILGIAYFFLVWRPQSNKITETRTQAEQTEQQVEQIKLEIARLKALRDRAPELRQQAAKLDAALPGEPQLAQFILSVQEAANTSGIDWLSISPSPPAASAGGGQAGQPTDVLVVNISMQING
ncbi:MAG: type 4a pilus biogenesis protein PilO, partial [Acidimicrobiia bacterium]